MPANATPNLSKNSIAKTLVDVYGVSALAADPVIIEWAVERVLKTESKESTAKALRQVNRARERMGKIPTFPRYGTALFAVY